MGGGRGTLGVIPEVSFKVLPRPAAEAPLVFEMEEDGALEAVNRWAGQPLPLSATSWHEGRLLVRLSGASSAIAAAKGKLGGEELASGDEHWRSLREHRLAVFPGARVLWRLSVRPT